MGSNNYVTLGYGVGMVGKCLGPMTSKIPAKDRWKIFGTYFSQQISNIWRSPDVTTTATEAADIQLQLTTHLSTPKG